MVAARPVDRVYAGRIRAITDGYCRECGRDVNPAALSEIDAREYRISGMCPACFDDVTREGDES